MENTTIKKILEGYYNEEMVTTLLPELSKIANSNELDEDELQEKFEECLAEHDADIFNSYVLFSQVRGKLPAERPAPYKPDNTVKVNVTKKDAEKWLTLCKDYDIDTVHKFETLLNEALNRNTGTFEVPVGYPHLDEFARLKFIQSYEEERIEKLNNLCKNKDIAADNGFKIGTKYHYMLYMVQLMNEYLKESSKSPRDIFISTVIMDGDYPEGTDYKTCQAILANFISKNKLELPKMVQSEENKKWSLISCDLSFGIDEDCFDEYDDEETSVAFFIIA